MKKIFHHRKGLLLILAVVLGLAASPQSFTVTANNTGFTANTATELEASSTVASAFSFNINSKNSNYSLFAGVTATSFTPSTTDFAGIPFKVKLRNITGVTNVDGGIAGEIPLLEYPPSYSVLAYEATKTTNNKTAVWTYDLTLNPVGYTVPPGTYNFTVTVLYADDETTITRNFTITLAVQAVLQLNLTQNNSTSVTFNNSAQYASGVTYAAFTTHGIKSNLPWLVKAASQSAYFTPASSGADNNMPCSIIGIKPSTGLTFAPLSVAGNTVKTGNAGNVTASGNSYDVDLRINPGYNYNAGIYNLGITYTLTNQ